jgi:pimeloyl-ACP methyl ester carboxylesterase
LLLLHGNPASMYDFAELAELLRDHFELAAVDLPGFGRSANPVPGRHESLLDTYARHVEAAATCLGWTEAFHLLGHSHGGAVAQALAALFPDRVSRLVLLASVGTPACWAYRQLVAPGVLPSLQLLARALRYPSPRPVRRRIVRSVMRPIFAPFPLPERWVDEQLANVDSRPEILVNMARVASGDPCGQLARGAACIRSPTLFIHGTSDSVVSPRYTRTLSGIIERRAKVEYRELTGAGHMLHLSHPALIKQLVVAFSVGAT